MNRIVVLVALALALILSVGALNAAQDARTPTGDVCASPVGSPAVGSPEATPVDVPLAPGVGPLVASPEASPETLVDCATPGVGTPVTVGDAAVEASPV
ncbi:MAG: hypothetical protein M3R02_26170 [Chloroflexota bacterium]|nr:hypothetical protein [Chloroflexota bacterium]